MTKSEEEIIDADFQKAQEIYDRIISHIAHNKRIGKVVNVPPILFALCLIYVRQLKHHKFEENVQQVVA